jgi:hypothetical protein
MNIRKSLSLLQKLGVSVLVLDSKHSLLCTLTDYLYVLLMSYTLMSVYLEY